MKTQRRPRQLSLLPAPRRRRRVRRWVAHKRREVNPRWPVHVTLRLRPHVYQLRSRRCFQIIEGAFVAALGKTGTRITQYSVQHNHIHLLAESADRLKLARVLQGFAIRVAKRLNKLMHSRGKVFADRYHSRALRTPTEVRAALLYVLGNARKHFAQLGKPLSRAWTDEFSSSAWFEGWEDARPPRAGPAPIARAATWLLTVGWWQRGGGRLRRDETPAPRTPLTRPGS